MWCGLVWCGVVWCGVVWCGVVWCGVVWCGVVWCGVVWCGVVWCAEGAGTKWIVLHAGIASRERCMSKRALCVVCQNSFCALLHCLTSTSRVRFGTETSSARKFALKPRYQVCPPAFRHNSPSTRDRGASWDVGGWGQAPAAGHASDQLLLRALHIRLRVYSAGADGGPHATPQGTEARGAAHTHKGRQSHAPALQCLCRHTPDGGGGGGSTAAMAPQPHTHRGPAPGAAALQPPPRPLGPPPKGKGSGQAASRC